ncbi:MAG: hypothetical protein KJ799_07955 [Bacteroidetes bacterium]|nr:hypothetical protein [Bacteroidota bacterium]MBU1677561.1 hypothetical protein [Bacteroidota bacterium]MBU2506642.1 hypothetical protein [Bacteroidota bacterium]
MNYSLTNWLSFEKSKVLLFDLLAILVIAFLPSISHLVAFPIYYLDPMRIIIIASLVLTTKRNTYLIALLLPLFSVLISSHPSIIKSTLILSELLLNVFLFYAISKKTSNLFLSGFASIFFSKVFYYSAKYILLSTAVMAGSLISTPLVIQIGMMILLSLFVLFFSSKIMQSK